MNDEYGAEAVAELQPGQWNKAGSNFVIMPEQMVVNSPLAQEFEIELPSIRQDYIDVLIDGTVANATYAGAAGPDKFLTDYMKRIRITDNSKNTPLDLEAAQIQPWLAFSQPVDAHSVLVADNFSDLTGAATTGLFNVAFMMRIYGPWQLSNMGKPVLKIKFELSDFTSVALNVRAAVLASDIQSGEFATGYYYVAETRAFAAYNEVPLGASMVEDIAIFTGQTTVANAAASITRIATSNVPAAEAILWEDDLIMKRLAYNALLGMNMVDSEGGVSCKELLTEGTLAPGYPLVIPHVDISHQLYRQLLIDRASGGSTSTIVITRNQVIF